MKIGLNQLLDAFGRLGITVQWFPFELKPAQERYPVTCGSFDLRKIVEAVNAIPTWIDAKERLPEAGELIVKRWKNGAVWAGKYAGTAKDSSFDQWMSLEEKT